MFGIKIFLSKVDQKNKKSLLNDKSLKKKKFSKGKTFDAMGVGTLILSKTNITAIIKDLIILVEVVEVEEEEGEVPISKIITLEVEEDSTITILGVEEEETLEVLEEEEHFLDSTKINNRVDLEGEDFIVDKNKATLNTKVGMEEKTMVMEKVCDLIMIIMVLGEENIHKIIVIISEKRVMKIVILKTSFSEEIKYLTLLLNKK